MDEHHEVFINYINQLYTGIMEKQTETELETIFEKFYQYAKFHFDSEEHLLSQHGYPKLQQQEKLHAEYMSKLATYKNLLFNYKESTAQEALSYFKDWFLNHIQTVDRQYNGFLNERGIE